MRFIALVSVLLFALTGCKSARQAFVVSVETQVFKQELADHPTTLRVEYRYGDQSPLSGDAEKGQRVAR
ncbi:MAG TPA: hypothetical protein PKV72_05745 [Candidatus Peribacteria bacterium]|nr:hypothetical protein [Candidatus Peribacteria bacterium]